MSRIYLPSTGAEDWRRLLADPEKHWRPGFSAMSLAECWESSADGLPPEVAGLFRPIGEAELLFGLPEHKVRLPGAKRAESQSDLFAIIRAGDTTFAATIEGKVDEPFGPLLGDWLKGASPGKHERLTFIAGLLGLTAPIPPGVHYQLLHRAAAAIIEAKRFKTDAAAMIVHSFSPSGRWYDAFTRFVALFGQEAGKGRLIRIDKPPAATPVYVAWAAGRIA